MSEHQTAAAGGVPGRLRSGARPVGVQKERKNRTAAAPPEAAHSAHPAAWRGRSRPARRWCRWGLSRRRPGPGTRRSGAGRSPGVGGSEGWGRQGQRSRSGWPAPEGPSGRIASSRAAHQACPQERQRPGQPKQVCCHESGAVPRCCGTARVRRLRRIRQGVGCWSAPMSAAANNRRPACQNAAAQHMPRSRGPRTGRKSAGSSSGSGMLGGSGPRAPLPPPPPAAGLSVEALRSMGRADWEARRQALSRGPRWFSILAPAPAASL